MKELEQLETMGYRFYLDGGKVRYVAVAPPPEAAGLLQRLDREKVRTLLMMREAGIKPLEPETLMVPWEFRYVYLQAIKAALDEGVLLHVEVMYHRKTMACEYHLQPPGLDLTPWLERSLE